MVNVTESISRTSVCSCVEITFSNSGELLQVLLYPFLEVEGLELCFEEQTRRTRVFSFSYQFLLDRVV